jgi:hypothetical protein
MTARGGEVFRSPPVSDDVKRLWRVGSRGVVFPAALGLVDGFRQGLATFYAAFWG